MLGLTGLAFECHNTDHLLDSFPCYFVVVDRADPFCSAAAQHFNQLLKRFGAPVVILNLVKVSFVFHISLVNICGGAVASSLVCSPLDQVVRVFNYSLGHCVKILDQTLNLQCFSPPNYI